jgi:hypothetical protein
VGWDASFIGCCCEKTSTPPMCAVTRKTIPLSPVVKTPLPQSARAPAIDPIGSPDQTASSAGRLPRIMYSKFLSELFLEMARPAWLAL